jgi:hypothetical protein
MDIVGNVTAKLGVEYAFYVVRVAHGSIYRYANLTDNNFLSVSSSRISRGLVFLFEQHRQQQQSSLRYQLPPQTQLSQQRLNKMDFLKLVFLPWLLLCWC